MAPPSASAAAPHPNAHPVSISDAIELSQAHSLSDLLASSTSVDLSYQKQLAEKLSTDRSPDSLFFYYCYGSNLCASILQHKGVHPLHSEPAILPYHIILFNLSVDSLVEPSFCNMQKTDSASDVVHGVLHVLKKDDMHLMDQLEGNGLVYVRSPVQIETYTKHFVMASAYIATNENRAKFKLFESPPSQRYLKTLVEGAKSFNLDPKWIHRLENEQTAPLPVLKLTEEHRKLIESREWSADELSQCIITDTPLSSTQKYLSSMKGLVFNVQGAEKSLPLSYLKQMIGKDCTINVAGRVASDKDIPKSIQEFNQDHKQYVDANLADWIHRYKIVGHLKNYKQYDW